MSMVGRGCPAVSANVISFPNYTIQERSILIQIFCIHKNITVKSKCVSFLPRYDQIRWI